MRCLKRRCFDGSAMLVDELLPKLDVDQKEWPRAALLKAPRVVRGTFAWANPRIASAPT